MISGIQKLSIYDPATGTTVQLNHISTGSTFKIKDVLTEEDGKGGTVYAGDDSEAKIVSFDTAGFSQLETWMNNGTPINFVAYGLEDNILWYENTTMDVNELRRTIRQA